MVDHFDAVIFKRIVRGGDHHTGRIIARAGQERDTRSGNNSGEIRIDVLGTQTLGDRPGEPCATFPRVHADHNARVQLASMDPAGESHAERVSVAPVKWGISGFATNPICSK